MNDKTTALATTLDGFIGFQAQKKKLEMVQRKREMNMSMTIDVSNNTLRDGQIIRVSPSKQDFKQQLPFIKGNGSTKHNNRSRYGNQSLGYTFGQSPGLYSSV